MKVNKISVGKSILFFAVGTSLIAQPYTPKEKTYVQPAQLENIFKDVSLTVETPGVNKNKVSFTSQEEMMEYLNKIVKQNKNIKMEIIGYSQEGREIPALFFSENNKFDKTKPTVWIQGQQHGNEPASGEGVLAVINQLSKENFQKELLSKINIIIIPRVNPDGSWLFKRGSASPEDINRDHTKLNLPETKALKKLFIKYQPEVVIDGHEYSSTPERYSTLGNKGVLPYYDVLMLSSTNPNLSKDITNIADNILIKNGEDNLSKKGLSGSWYYTSVPKKDKTPFTLEMASGDAIIGRNAFGLVPSISILVETRGIGIGRENFSRRVESHLTIYESFLKDVALNSDKVRDTVRKAREEVIQKGLNTKDHDEDKVIIVSNIKDKGMGKYKFIDLETNEVKEFPVKIKTSKEQDVVLERSRPYAYILPPGYRKVADILENHGVTYYKTMKPVKLKVESYEVKDIKKADQIYEGQYRTYVKADTVTKEVLFPSGSYIYTMDQSQGDFIALSMEPESSSSFVLYNIVPVTDKNQIHIYRAMDNLNIKELDVTTK
ncbi:MAG: M14 family metallocarboxypeptidase [Cetobacterium sp.]|uniref:M14 family metallopeptidase n=1 Tax=Cetobacterium sp. TaxID=2071632 RepID=UPI002FC77C50